MIAHLKYVWYVARHKWFVLLAGLKTKAPFWYLLIHDWSKFTRAEWGPYVEKFYGGPAPEDLDDRVKKMREDRFQAAWRHHYTHNPHHWNFWVNESIQYGVRTAQEPPYAREMPDYFVREMVADWMGAGRAITGQWEIASWYAKNADKMILHPKTRAAVDRLVASMDSTR